MPLYHGTTLITDIRHGATPITEVRHGDEQVWARSVTRDNFDRDDAATLGGNWTDHGPSSDYKMGIENGAARIQIPEGLVGGFFDLRTSRMRFNAATAHADDGYVECRPSSMGSSGSLLNGALTGFVTQVFGRLSNSAFSHGMGIELNAGHASIVRLVSGTFAVVKDGGTFVAGNRLRLVYVGNLHRLYRNGYQLCEWNDSGATASKGLGYRSLGVVGQGGKDVLGPRRFSPALDYVLMG
ncbi:hypothetical protein B1R94_02400 [Mycolicibacterium litorale]|nr:hypothetical protein B1R94_02400 [Mycolicibacterium litorale]